MTKGTIVPSSFLYFSASCTQKCTRIQQVTHFHVDVRFFSSTTTSIVAHYDRRENEYSGFTLVCLVLLLSVSCEKLVESHGRRMCRTWVFIHKYCGISLYIGSCRANSSIRWNRVASFCSFGYFSTMHWMKCAYLSRVSSNILFYSMVLAFLLHLFIEILWY